MEGDIMDFCNAIYINRVIILVLKVVIPSGSDTLYPYSYPYLKQIDLRYLHNIALNKPNMNKVWGVIRSLSLINHM